MGFLDFLKGILPDSLIKVDNRKIEIKNSEIVVGDKTITDKEIINKIFDKISENKDKDSFPFHILHKDLLEDYIDYEDISINNKDNLKLIKSILSQEDVECILMARRVSLAYDKNNKKLADDLLKQLDKNYPKKGRKVFNLIGGNYFDTLILPFIEIYKSEYGDKYAEEYRRFYGELIRFFPIAVFVGNYTTEDKVEEELTKRLKLKSIPFIRIHAIGSNNIKKVEKVIEKLEINKKCSTNDKRFTTSSGLKAQIYEIRLK